jgi:hypothetical protein
MNQIWQFAAAAIGRCASLLSDLLAPVSTATEEDSTRGAMQQLLHGGFTSSTACDGGSFPLAS